MLKAEPKVCRKLQVMLKAEPKVCRKLQVILVYCIVSLGFKVRLNLRYVFVISVS